MPTINSSVGRAGRNVRADVVTVQKLLNEQDLSPLATLEVDGVSGSLTVGAIEHFQEKIVGMSRPDGRVDPGGRTLRRLTSQAGTPAPAGGGSGGSGGSSAASTGTSGNLSGAAWWRANQARYPNSQRVEDLDGDFRVHVEAFVSALGTAGARVAVASTRRNATRAHLMHYSWKVAHGQIAAADVPSVSGLSITWDHGDAARSRRAADEMVRLFHMAHIASLTSNHIRGKAIDMTITWQGDLPVKPPGATTPTVIRTGPRNGADNRELHDVGRRFGVMKLRSDPPHWSENGR